MTADDTKVLDKKDVNSYLTTPDYIPPAQQPTKDTQHSLRVSVADAMQRYFDDLDGQSTVNLYDLVLAEVEAPLLTAVMAYTRQNQSKASEILGLNRGTLRKKLKQYDLL
ncbi:MAG: DNA-binding transcriptional regulator Fis [Porticoccaceae bacterium]|jgi:Fis family transcriptional regulator|nr:DNA-binding transcriptional regulator Fis [Porticoccaceae bacterium]MBT6422153.1 DNA-binding transcriptional regulator Fis [Porticoccaceae bacterium]MBT6692995.1 DNA-binding transcriptional regulator Fis [Porticoccaceae bacterium]